jgi:hypothetical protein
MAQLISESNDLSKIKAWRNGVIGQQISRKRSKAA